MRILPLIFFFAVALPLRAEPAYHLDIGAEVHERNLKVEPSVSGPAGKIVRYEISVVRGASSSSQAGDARLDDDGYAKLASTSASVQPGEDYRVTVKLFEGTRLVAQQSVRRP